MIWRGLGMSPFRSRPGIPPRFSAGHQTPHSARKSETGRMRPPSHGCYERHSLSNSVYEKTPLIFISVHILYQHRLARLSQRISSHISDTHIAPQHTQELCARYPVQGSVALFNRTLTPAFMERKGIFRAIQKQGRPAAMFTVFSMG